MCILLSRLLHLSLVHQLCSSAYASINIVLGTIPPTKQTEGYTTPQPFELLVGSKNQPDHHALETQTPPYQPGQRRSVDPKQNPDQIRQLPYLEIYYANRG